MPGFEQKAIALFGEAMVFWGGQQQAGNVESFEPVFLSPYGGDLNGFILVRGEETKLNQILASDEYIAQETKVNYMLVGHRVIRAVLGDEITRRMGIFQQVTSGE